MKRHTNAVNSPAVEETFQDGVLTLKHSQLRIW